MLEQSPHQTNAVAIEESTCVEVDRNDIMILLQRKPHAGMDMLSVLGRQFFGLIATGTLATPTVADGVVYCGDYSGTLYALNATSGALLWTYDTGTQICEDAPYITRPTGFRLS